MEQLLLIKEGADYFRFSGDGYVRCSLQKASVYPMQQLAQVKALHSQLLDEGCAGARIMLLSLTEQPFIQSKGEDV